MVLIRWLSVREHLPESDAVAPDVTGVGEGPVVDGLWGVPGGEDGEEREDGGEEGEEGRGRRGRRMERERRVMRGGRRIVRRGEVHVRGWREERG